MATLPSARLQDLWQPRRRRAERRAERSVEVSLDLVELFENARRLRVRDGRYLGTERKKRLSKIGSLVRGDLVGLIVALKVLYHGVESLAEQVDRVLGVRAGRV